MINVLTWSAVKFLNDCESCELFRITWISGIITFPPVSVLCVVSKFCNASFAPASKNGKYSLGFVYQLIKIKKVRQKERMEISKKEEEEGDEERTWRLFNKRSSNSKTCKRSTSIKYNPCVQWRNNASR